MDYNRLTTKKELLDSYRPLSPEIAKNLAEWFRVELTYTSNALEGNTLTRQETALVLEKGITIGGKLLKEHLEATNHAEAWDWLQTLIEKQAKQINKTDILELHRLILKGIDDQNAGCYRSVAVRIAGSTVVFPNPLKVPLLMDEFIHWLKVNNELHPVALATQAHYQLVSIHPFIDGNGRTARLLMNLLLLQAGYPPTIIGKRDRLIYLNSLEHAQLGGSREPFDQLIAKAVSKSFDIYLKAVEASSS